MGLVRVLHRFLVRQTMPALAVDYYERLSDAVSGFYLAPLVNDINTAFVHGGRILDVGTGIGHLPLLLAQGNPRHQITGLDLSRSALRRAQARVASAGVSARVRFVHGGLSSVRGNFDLIVSTCSLHHWRHPGAVLNGMAGLMAAGGQLWLMDDYGDSSEEERRKWVLRVEAAFDAGSIFRRVFNFESRHLAYGEKEVRALCERAALRITEFQVREVFFLAKCRR